MIGAQQLPPPTAAERQFLQADQLTRIQPLRLKFHKGILDLGDNDRAAIEHWAARAAPHDIPVYIRSMASLPTGIRDLTPDAARHEAIRMAFNRGLLAKNLLEQYGIDRARLILTARAPEEAGLHDRIIITTRRE